MWLLEKENLLQLLKKKKPNELHHPQSLGELKEGDVRTVATVIAPTAAVAAAQRLLPLLQVALLPAAVVAVVALQNLVLAAMMIIGVERGVANSAVKRNVRSLPGDLQKMPSNLSLPTWWSQRRSCLFLLTHSKQIRYSLP